MLRTILAGLMLLLAACDQPANVAAPLAGPPEAVFPPGLAGVWMVADTGEGEDGAVLSAMTGVLMLWPSADGMRVQGSLVLSELRPEGEPPLLSSMVMEWIARPALIGDTLLGSARFVAGGLVVEPGPDGTPVVKPDPHYAPHPDRGWWVFTVLQPEPDRLELRMLSEERMVLAVRQRGLPVRTVSCGPDCSHAVFDLDGDSLRALIGELGFADLFPGDPIVLRRVRPGALGGLH